MATNAFIDGDTIKTRRGTIAFCFTIGEKSKSEILKMVSDDESTFPSFYTDIDKCTESTKCMLKACWEIAIKNGLFLD